MAVTWRACIGQRVFAYKFVLFSQRPPIVLRAGAFGKIQAIVVALRKMEQQIPQENETSQIIQTGKSCFFLFSPPFFFEMTAALKKIDAS